MKLLTVIIPTFNRSDLMVKTVESLARASSGLGALFSVLVVDNNSKSEHSEKYRATVEQYAQSLDIAYSFEKKQGRSNALNLGVALAATEYVAFVDDDEQVDPSWLGRALEWVQGKHGEFDFVTGPYLPNWETEPPKWLPAMQGQYRGLLGWIEQGTQVALLKDIHGELVGGNCVLKKKQIQEVGGFNPNLGRSNNNLMGGEDGDMHNKLVSRGYAGFYDPGLIIHHWVPVFRMTVAYHLKWAYWSGVSNGLRLIDHPESRENVPHVLGFPRYWIGKGVFGLLTYVKELLMFGLKQRPDGIIGLMNFNYLRGLATCRLFR